MKVRGVVLERTGGPHRLRARPRADRAQRRCSCACTQAASAHSDYNAVGRTSERVCPAVSVTRAGRRPGRRRQGVTRRRPRSRRPVLDVLVRDVRRVPARSPQALLDRLARHGHGGASWTPSCCGSHAMDSPSTATRSSRPSRTPALSPSARASRSPRHPVRDRWTRRVRRVTEVGAVWRGQVVTGIGWPSWAAVASASPH